MSALSPVDAAVSWGATIGKYFATVNVLPSSFLVTFVTVLFSIGAWNGPVDPGRLGTAIDAFTFQDLAWFVTAALLIGVAILPLQFALTQVLEGYWGASRLAIRIATREVTRHHRQAVALQEGARRASRGWIMRGSRRWKSDWPLDQGQRVSDEEMRKRERHARRFLALPESSELLPDVVAHQAFERKLRDYPLELHRIMPTRLGNVLRQSEDRAGEQYGLDTLAIAPHLSLVADANHYAYVRDRQRAMDIAITMCLVSTLATGAAAVLLADDGPWSLVSFLPFSLAYLSYVGAVAAARSYNVAVETVTDLSRFALYEALRVAPPKNGKEERSTAEALVAMIKGAWQPEMQFEHPAPPTTPGSE
jgi:hypothetical protein